MFAIRIRITGSPWQAAADLAVSAVHHVTTCKGSFNLLGILAATIAGIYCLQQQILQAAATDGMLVLMAPSTSLPHYAMHCKSTHACLLDCCTLPPNDE